MVHHDYPTGSQQSDPLADEVRLASRFGVDKHQIVGLVGEAGKDLLCPPCDESGPSRPDAGLAEGLLRQALILRFDVDRGQHTVVAHAREQPQSADSGPGTDLDNCFSAAEPGQQAQQSPDSRGDRAGADVHRAFAGSADDGVLGDRPLSVGQEPLGPARPRFAAGIVVDGHSQQRRSTPLVCVRTRQGRSPRPLPAAMWAAEKLAEK